MILAQVPASSSEPSRPPLPPTLYHHQPDGERIAYIHHEEQLSVSDGKESSTCIEKHSEEDKDGAKSGILFLPGFRSRMRSTKSQALFEYCHRTSREFTTLDYYGHGESSGGDEEGHKHNHNHKGTISRWTDDVLTILDNVTCSPKQIIVGSSMGSWIMMIAASSRIDRVSALVGIASAPDFTSLLSKQIQAQPELYNQMNLHGYCDMPTVYDESGFYRIHRELLVDGQNHFLLDGQEDSIPLSGRDNIPLVLIHGKKDEDISWKLSEQLLQRVDCEDKKLILVENGDHRLSSVGDLEIILSVIDELV